MEESYAFKKSPNAGIWRGGERIIEIMESEHQMLSKYGSNCLASPLTRDRKGDIESSSVRRAGPSHVFQRYKSTMLYRLPKGRFMDFFEKEVISIFLVLQTPNVVI